MPQNQTQGRAPITHLPVAPAPAVPINVPQPAGNAPRTIASPAPGNRSLTIGQITMQIDPTKHTPMNIVDIINNANISGVVASLDRYGQLVITGGGAIGGDSLLLQLMGLA